MNTRIPLTAKVLTADLDDMIVAARLVRSRNGCSMPAVVKNSDLGNGRTRLGFHFQNGLQVGQKGKNLDGTPFVVLAIVW